MTATTWDSSLKAANISLSESDMRADAGQLDYESVLATAGYSTGKKYFEIGWGKNSVGCAVGLAPVTMDVEKQLGEQSSDWGYLASGRYANGTMKSGKPAWQSEVNPIIGVAIDFDAHKMWFSLNGSWQGDPAAGTGQAFSNLSGTLRPAATTYYSDDWCVCRFLEADCSYSAPSGFDFWDASPDIPVVNTYGLLNSSVSGAGSAGAVICAGGVASVQALIANFGLWLQHDITYDCGPFTMPMLSMVAMVNEKAYLLSCPVAGERVVIEHVSESGSIKTNFMETGNFPAENTLMIFLPAPGHNDGWLIIHALPTGKTELLFQPFGIEHRLLRIAGLGSVQNKNLIHTGSPLETFRMVLSQVGTYVRVQAALMQFLARGDQASVVGLLNSPGSMSTIIECISQFSESIQSFGIIREILARGDQSQNTLMLSSPAGQEIQTQLIQKLSAAIQSRSLMKITESSDPVLTALQMTLALLSHDDIRVRGLVSIGSESISSVFQNTSSEIYLDGRPLSGRVLSPITITYDEGNVHNSISFSSSDPELYRLCDPMTMPGEIRLEAQVGGRMMQFIIVERTGEDINFSVEAISVSAKEDEFADDIDFTMTEPLLASAIASSLTNYCPVTWSAFDWVVPASFTFSGKPIDGILQLAGAIGAVVRCQDDGSLLVRKKRPVRPVNMPVTTAAVDYTDADLLSLSHDDEPASGYNAIEVYGYSDDVYLPMLQVEESSPVQGDTVHIRVFWGNNNPSVDETYVTAGIISVMGAGAFTEIEQEEIIDFTDGTGSVSLPIKSLTSYAWIGTPAGDISATVGGRDLIVPDSPGFGIASVKYISEYQRYELTGHDVEQLIAVFFMAAGRSVYTSIRTSEDPVYASPITEDLLTSDAAAVERGTAEIDAMKYRKSILTVSAPYLDSALDGVLAHVNDPHISAIGNYHITASIIEIDGPKITNTLRLDQCLIS